MAAEILTEKSLEQLFYHLRNILPFWSITVSGKNKKPKKGLWFQWTLDLRFPRN